MTLVELKYVLALAQEGHFGRAASRCHVSQPTLSVAIDKLEKSLNVCIFERQTKGFRITEVGERLIEQAQAVIEAADKFSDIAEGSRHQLDTPLKLGGIYTVAPYLFPSLIPELKKQAPKMPLIINEDCTKNLRVKLQLGELDAIFVALPFDEPSVVVKPLYEEPFVVLMPKNHVLSKQAAINASDLAGENMLILGEGHCFRDQVLKACPQCYTPNEFQQIIEGSSLETLRHMVASGLGITVLPATATSVTHYSKTLITRPFKTSKPKRTIALAWRASFPRAKAIDALIQSLQCARISNVCPINS